jgi:sodium-dependent dicarboxylate transporter 2/3/5
MAFAVPISFLLLVAAWTLVCSWHVWGKEKIPVDLQVFRDVKRQLGPMKYEEYVVSIYIFLTIVSWFSGKYLKPHVAMMKNMGSASIGLFWTMPLFFIPTMNKKLEKSSDGKMLPAQHILDWSYAMPKFKWQILITFGGGYIVAKGTQVSGFAAWVASLINPMPEIALVAVVVIVICFLTEVISNMASVLIFGPILIEVAASLCVSPLKMLLVVCFASSFAFMMPMAGGPNMLVYGTGQDFSLRFMIRHGFALNCIACIIGVLYLNYIMPTILDPNQYGVPKKLINKTSGCGW